MEHLVDPRSGVQLFALAMFLMAALYVGIERLTNGKRPWPRDERRVPVIGAAIAAALLAVSFVLPDADSPVDDQHASAMAGAIQRAPELRAALGPRRPGQSISYRDYNAVLSAYQARQERSERELRREMDDFVDQPRANAV